MRDRHLRALAALSLAGLGAALVPLTMTSSASAEAVPAVGSAGVAQAWRYDPNEVLDPAEIANRASDEGVTPAVAEVRLRLDRAAGDLQSKAAARYPDTFAGLWISRPDFKVHVAFTTAEQASRDALATEFASPASLVADSASTSLADLLNLQKRVNSDRLAQKAKSSSAVPSLSEIEGAYDTEVDVQSGKVVLHVPAGTAEKAKPEVARAYGAAVQVVSGAAKPATCYVTDCRYAMLGGIELMLGTNASAGYCSSAFTGTSSGNRVVLSAGHCYAETGNSIRQNAYSSYGYTQAYRYSGGVDAERVVRNSSTWRESSKFYVAGQNPRSVTSYTASANVAVGAYLGKSGRTTGTTYGYVKSKTISPGYVPNATATFVSADFCVAPGDSGGAIFTNSSAVGINSGYFPGTACRQSISGAGVGIYGAIDSALSALGVSLITGVNVAPTASYTHSCTALLSCSFYGSGDDEDGSVVSYSWNFGDGTTGSGSAVTHTYSLPGSKTVTLTVRDNNNAAASTTQTFTVL